MRALFLCTLSCAAIALALPEPAHAHGGKYTGPGDIVPPNPGGGSGRPPGGGPVTPGEPGPSVPGPDGVPTTPTGGPNGPGVPGPGPGVPGPGVPVSGGGIPIGDDLGRWQFWWEFNKDPFLNLKEAIHAGAIVSGSDEVYLGSSRRSKALDLQKPTRDQVLGSILPALKRALDQTDDRDITSSCMIAMAKIGEDTDGFRILEEFRRRLRSGDQEIRETAAIAMGISQKREAIDDLAALALDTPGGRQLCQRAEVDNRTRAFACYGLGLIAHATSDVRQKRLCFEALRDVLAASTDPMTDRNVPVAAINGMRLLRPNPQSGAKSVELLDECIDVLFRYYLEDLGPGEQLVQAHVPPAIAQLLGRGGDAHGTFKERFAAELAGRFGKRRDQILQSAAVALGILCQPREVAKGDGAYSDRLLAYWKDGKDEQTRSFCAIALGKIGGEANRSALLQMFDRGSKAIEKPWVAIALGVLAHGAAEAAGARASVDRVLGDTLHRGLNDVKNGETQSAIAVALGLCAYRGAADDLRGYLEKYGPSRDQFTGYLCIGLALMDDRRSIEQIREIVAQSVRRPDRLQQAAIALGKLGDKSVTELLQQKLADPSHQSLAPLSAIAQALGFIGDCRTVDPLVRMLHDASITPLSRAFAAVALGGVADKEPLPWNSKIAVDMNYRAAVETLTNQQSGIIDIL